MGVLAFMWLGMPSILSEASPVNSLESLVWH